MFQRVRTDCDNDEHIYEAPARWSSQHTYLMLHRTFECLICRRAQIVIAVGPDEVVGRDLFEWLLDGDRTCP